MTEGVRNPMVTMQVAGWLEAGRTETINGTTYERMLVKLDRLPQDQASPYRQPSQGGAMLLGPF